MNQIASLVRMNLLKLMSLGKLFIFYAVIAVVFCMSSSLIPFAYILLLYLIVYAPHAYDEQSKGNYLIGALPVSRTQVVQANYLYAALSLAAISVVLMVINKLLAILLPMSIQFNGVSIGGLFSGLFFTGCVFIGLVLPLVLYLGVTKARYVVMALYILCFAASGVLLSFLKNQIQVSPLIMVVFGAVLLVISYMVALQLYGKREFRE